MPSHLDDTLKTGGSRPGRVALISDVHGNLPAFRAVVDDIARAGVDEVWCLGDLVGYGAQPDECVALAAETCDVALTGNHDLVVLGRLDISDFSRHAAVAAEWTRDRLGADAVSYLSALEPANTARPVGLFHASPRDPVWEYVLSTEQAGECMGLMDARVGAVGHSHVALCFWQQDGEGPEGRQAPAGTEIDVSSGRWLLMDLAAWTASWRRVDYPIEEAAEAIRTAGLPAVLADRLFHGQ